MKRLAIILAVWVGGTSLPLQARIPEVELDPKDGVWIAQGESFIFQTQDQWTVFSAGATVNRMVADGTVLWLATDDGVVRFDTGSRKATRLGMEEGLPSQRVATVAKDDTYVWFGTNKGLVRYRKSDRSLKIYDESHGLPHKAITSSVRIGRQVWFGTRAGIAVYSADVDGLRGFGVGDGFIDGEVQELFQIGDDLWCRLDQGIVRFRISQRVFTHFPISDWKANEITVFRPDGSNLLLGTDQGLFEFQAAGDTVVLWAQQSALQSKRIVGVEVTPEYLFIATDQEVVQYSKITKSIRRFTQAEGLARQNHAVGTVMQGGSYTVLFPDGAEVLSIARDLWSPRSLLNQDKAASTSSNIRLFGTMDSSMPYDFTLPRPKGWRDGLENERYANLKGGLGVGHQFSQDRVLNGSLRLDYGQLEASGIRDLEYKVEYLGNANDVLREARVEDKLLYRFVEEGLERPLFLQGAHVRMASPGTEPKVQAQVNAGFRRGQVVRDFITGARQEAYALSQRYIIPGSERVTVDGELLTSGTDYTVLYTAGQLVFLNPEQVDDLSVISVEYEYDLIPKKDLGTLSLSAMLPGDSEIGGWVKSGEPRLISDTTGLFNQIDGAAPKYIDRNWVRSVYAEYRYGGRSIQVAIHDMADEIGAESIFLFDQPTSRVPIEDRENAVMDTGLPSAYAAKAHFERYYVEVSIDERSDASLVFVQSFVKAITDRKSQAASHRGDTFQEWMVAGRAAFAPIQGMELGARVVQMARAEERRQTRVDENGNSVYQVVPHRQLLSGTADARFQKAFGEGGLLTGYAEMAGAHVDEAGTSDGFASMGFVRLSHPKLEGIFSGRLDSRRFSGLGSTQTRFGKLHDELRLSATGYPAPWLPSTVFFTRQRAYLPDGSEGQGTISHTLARMQLNRSGLPATTLQVGVTRLENPNVFQTERLQGSAQVDYDLAPLLSFTRIKRFHVRGLYRLSQAETEEAGAYAYADRVRLIRLEGKLSPTVTESLWAQFRVRNLGRQTEKGGPFYRGTMRWELLSGAQSTLLPGLVPKANYNVVYEDNRLPAVAVPTSTNPPVNLGSAISSVTPPGPGDLVVTVPTRTSKGTAGASLGIYPGQWIPRLSALAFEPSFAVGGDAQSVDEAKTIFHRTYDLVALEVYAGQRLELELYQRYRFTTTDRDAHRDSENLLLRNRVVYRHLPTSPITLRLNYQEDRALNPATLVGPTLEPWADKVTYEAWLEWLSRWNKIFTSRIRLRGMRERTSDYAVTDAKTGQTQTYNYRKYTLGGDLESRLFPMEDVSALYLFQRVGLFRLFGSGQGSVEAWSFAPAAGVIWRKGEVVYLEGQVSYDWLACLSSADCKTVSRLEPRVFLTVNL